MRSGVLLLAIALAVIGGSGLIKETGLVTKFGVKDANESLQIVPEFVAGDIPIKGDCAYKDLGTLDSIIVEPTLINIKFSGGSLLVNTEKVVLDSDSSEVRLSNFTGTIIIDQGKASLEGSSTGFWVNAVKLQPLTTSLSISAEELLYRDITINEVGVQSIELTCSGSLEASAVRITLNDEALALRNYYGELCLTSTSLTLNGATSYVTAMPLGNIVTIT